MTPHEYEKCLLVIKKDLDEAIGNEFMLTSLMHIRSTRSANLRDDLLDLLINHLREKVSKQVEEISPLMKGD